MKKREWVPTSSSGSTEDGGGKLKKGFVDKADSFLKRNKNTIDKSPGTAIDEVTICIRKTQRLVQ